MHPMQHMQPNKIKMAIPFSNYYICNLVVFEL